MQDGVVAGCNTWLPPPPDSTAPDEEPSTQHSVEQRFRSLLAIAERHFCGCTDVAGLLDGLEAAQRQAAAAAAAAPGAGAAPSEELYAEVLQALHQCALTQLCRPHPRAHALGHRCNCMHCHFHAHAPRTTCCTYATDGTCTTCSPHACVAPGHRPNGLETGSQQRHMHAVLRSPPPSPRRTFRPYNVNNRGRCVIVTACIILVSLGRASCMGAILTRGRRPPAHACHHGPAGRCCHACRGSPISMCLTLRSMRRGAHSTLREVLRSDFRGVSHCTRHGWDLWEGVTARLVERRPPRWRYSGPALVPQAIVDTAFGPPAFCEELDLAPVDALFRRRGDTPSAKL